MLRKFKEWFPRQTPIVKLFSLILIWIAAVAIYVGVMAMYGFASQPVYKAFKGMSVYLWYFPIYTRPGRILTFVTTILIYIAILFYGRGRYRNLAISSMRDERGINYMENNVHGSAKWMTNKKEIQNAFTVSDIYKTDTTIYGQLTDDGRAVVGYKPSLKGNRNVMMLASSGSGKSFTYVRTELIQAALRGNSFVATDPSGELFTDLAKFCYNQGMKVKVLNLVNLEHSDFWDCLQETINPETERLDAQRLEEFANIYMQNSGDGGKQDFWYNSALNLLKATIGYTAYTYESAIVNRYIALYNYITNNSSNIIPKEWTTNFVSFPKMRKVILNEATRCGVDEKGIERISQTFKDIKEYASKTPYNMKQLTYNIFHFTEIEKDFDNIPSFHPAKYSYLTYKSNDTDAVRKSALQGIQLRFGLFTNENLQNVLSYNGIELKKINQERTACFVVTSDKDLSLKPIASLFFSFLFKDVQDVYDEAEQYAKENGIRNKCLDLVAMLDEFYSLGIIGGSPNAFGTTMSNSRKRHIYISIILQSYSQLEVNYKEVMHMIQSNCSTLLYLGGNDPETLEFISKFAGTATVLNESHKRYGGIIGTERVTDMRVTSTKRPLLTEDEARKWRDKVLVIKQGEDPLRLLPFAWIEHPVYEKYNLRMNALSLKNGIKNIEERMTVINASRLKIPDEYLDAEIKSIHVPYTINHETGETIERIEKPEPQKENVIIEAKKEKPKKSTKKQLNGLDQTPKKAQTTKSKPVKEAQKESHNSNDLDASKLDVNALARALDSNIKSKNKVTPNKEETRKNGTYKGLHMLLDTEGKKEN